MAKKRYLVKIGIIVSLLIIIGVFFMSFIYDRVPDNLFCFRDIGTHRIPPDMIEVRGTETVGQTFVSNFNNLFKVAVFISTKDADKNAILSFHLKEPGANEDIVFKQWRISQIRPQRNNFYLVPPDRESDKGFHYHIQFAPLKDSKHRELYFYFTYLDSDKARGIKFGIWKQRYYEALTRGAIHINHIPGKDFLAFRTYNTYLAASREALSVIWQRLRFDRAFLSFYFILLTSIAITLVIVYVKK